MPERYRPSREALQVLLSDRRDFLVRVRCCRTHHYVPDDLIRLFGNHPVLLLHEKMRRCEVCGSGESLSISLVYPSGSAVRPHAPLALNGTSISYDANGNMTSDGIRALVWDEANRLSRVTIGGAETRFAYGPDGARARKSHAYGATLYPSADVEIDVSGTVTGAAAFTRYPHIDVKVVGATKYWLHRDHLASVRFVTDAAGALVESTAYAAYGEQLNTGFQTQKSYIGERYDPETGLLYLNARYMDPKWGRFISPDDWDPIIEGVGTNRYAYAENDPINKSDANGHYAKPDSERSRISESEGKTDESESAGDGATSDRKNAIPQEEMERAIDAFDPRQASMREAQKFSAPCACDLNGNLPGNGIGGIGLGGGARGFGSAGVRSSGGVKAQENGVKSKTRSGGESSAAAVGREAHKELSKRVLQKPGWQSEPRLMGADGKVYKPDVVTPGNHILEYKPNTPSGRAAGRRQIQKYERQLEMRGRVIYYDP
jgi:RHS repeat-associated protein